MSAPKKHGGKTPKVTKILKTAKVARDDARILTFGKFMRALEQKPALRKKLITARAITLKSAGIAPRDYQQVREAFATLRKFHVAVDVDFAWPDEPDPSILVDSISPNPISPDTRTLVTIRGSNFPKQLEFGLHNRANQTRFWGELETRTESADGFTEITGFITAVEGQYELRVGTDEDSGALGNVIVGSDS